jgi:putative ABC transport system substrate-binding protein
VVFLLDKEGKKMKTVRMNKVAMIVISIVLIAGLLVGCSSEEKKDGVKTIGVVQLASHPALDATLEGLKAHLEEAGLTDQVTIVVKNAQGDPGIALSIANQFVSDEVDLIYAIATNAAQAAFNATEASQIPVVFNAVTDPVDAGIAASLESSGNHVTGVSDAAPLQKQLELIKEILPNATKIGLLYNLGEPNGKLQVEQVAKLAPTLGLEALILGVSAANEISAAASQLASQVDAMYNITDNMIAEATALIVDKANEKNIPVFGAEDGQLDQGLLAVDGLSYFNLGVQAGSLVEDILFNNVKPTDLAIKTAEDTELKVQVDIAKNLNITLPESVLSRLSSSN